MKDLNELTLHDSYITGIEVETKCDHFDRIVIKLNFDNIVCLHLSTDCDKKLFYQLFTERVA